MPSCMFGADPHLFYSLVADIYMRGGHSPGSQREMLDEKVRENSWNTVKIREMSRGKCLLNVSENVNITCFIYIFVKGSIRVINVILLYNSDKLESRNNILSQENENF